MEPATGEISEALVREAARYRAEGHLDDALGLYSRLVQAAESKSEKSVLYETIGDLLTQKGDTRAAIGVFRQAMALAPSDTVRAKYDTLLDAVHDAPPAPVSVAKSMPDPAPKPGAVFSEDAPPAAAGVPTAEPHEEVPLFTPQMLRTLLIIGVLVIVLVVVLMLVRQ